MSFENKLDRAIAMINQAIVLGWQRPQMSAWAAKQAPPITEADLDAAYAACVDQWIAQASLPQAELYALHVARREGLYRKAMDAGDIPLAFNILRDQAKLQQQYQSERRQAEQASKESDLEARIKARGRPALNVVPKAAVR